MVGWLLGEVLRTTTFSKIQKTFLFILILDWFRIAELPGGKGLKGRASEREGRGEIRENIIRVGSMDTLPNIKALL